MRRIVLIATAALVALAAVPAGGASALQSSASVKVQVTPGTGGARTAFKLSFRSPSQTGAVGSVQRSDRVEIAGTHHPGCVWSGQMALPNMAAQQVMRVSLTPGKMSPTGATTWCIGTFHGSIVQTERFLCMPPDLCPMLEIRPQTIAHFTFTVRRRS
jgi:hypothetical protein